MTSNAQLSLEAKDGLVNRRCAADLDVSENSGGRKKKKPSTHLFGEVILIEHLQPVNTEQKLCLN